MSLPQQVDTAPLLEALQLQGTELEGRRKEATALQERVSALELDLAAARAEGPASAAAEAASERASLRTHTSELDEEVADLRAEVHSSRHIPGYHSDRISERPEIWSIPHHLQPSLRGHSESVRPPCGCPNSMVSIVEGSRCRRLIEMS